MCLFSRHAFGREIPIEGYKELSEQVLCYAAGLPLTIKVLGSFLCGKDDLDWKDAIERLKTIPLNETMKVLELSYIDLEKDYKEIFLDVACLLKGWQKDDAIKALESCGFHARSGLRVLEHKSLITIDNGFVGMHDHIEEMGMNIVRRVNPNKPERHSRLWIDQEIQYILANDSGTYATKCITLDARGFNFEILINGFANMKELRFLQVETPRASKDIDNWSVDEVGLYLPNALGFLSWSYYPFSSLPKAFQAKNLVTLTLGLSSIVQLWKDGEEKVLIKLRFLTIMYSDLRTLDLGFAPNLEMLSLHSCTDMVELRIPSKCTKLVNLQISLENCTDIVELKIPTECPKIVILELEHLKLTIPDLWFTPNLETLILENCTDMVELKIPAECPKLVGIFLSNLKLTTLHIPITPNLKTLSLRDCTHMVELKIPVECPKLDYLLLHDLKLTALHLGIAPNLEMLSLQNCVDMVELQTSECPKLVYLKLSNLNLTTLRLGITPNLETLSLEECTGMVELKIPAECPKLVFLELRDLKLTTLDLGISPNLETLRLHNCTDMLELNIPSKCSKLINLQLSNLKLTTLRLGINPNLETLSLENCTGMVKLRIPVECPNLVFLELRDLKLTTLDLGISPNLETLSYHKCTDMVELQIPSECPMLVTLHLYDTPKLRALDLALTPNLESLNLRNCYDLEEINAPAECLKKLLHLEITNCGRFESFEFDKELDSPEVVSLSELHLTADHADYTNDADNTDDTNDADNTDDADDTNDADDTDDADNTDDADDTDDAGDADDANDTDDTGICDLSNTWPQFQFSCYYKEDSTSSFGNLERLMSLGFGSPINTDSFSDIVCGLQCLRKLTLKGGIPEAPKNLHRLDCLEELNLESTYIKTLPDSICMLKHLKSLRFVSCLRIEKLPADIGRLECLESLILFDCTLLQDIPTSICDMRRLKCLELSYCIQLEKLPEEIGRLECLKELDILGSGIRHLPHSLYALRGLRIIGDRWLLESCDLTPTKIDSDFTDEMVCYI